MPQNLLQLSSTLTVLFVLTVFQIHQGDTAHHTHSTHTHHAHTQAQVTPTHTPATVLAGKYNEAYVVRHDGCFQLQLNNHQFKALRSHHGDESAAIQAELAAMVDHAIGALGIHEIDHHSIDSEHADIQTQCNGLPVFRITVADNH